VLLIDVREASWYEQETIPGAIHMPFASLQEVLKGHPQEPNARVHERDRKAELAGCEAGGGPRRHDGRVLSDPKLEGAGLPDGARQEAVVGHETVDTTSPGDA
jgi:hypothetical protein